MTPDIVKLDRSLIVQGTTNERARRILPKLVEIIHELGAQVVCEGVENLDQHRLAVDAGADLVQGYYDAQPSSDLLNPVLQTDTRPTHLSDGLDWPHQHLYRPKPPPSPSRLSVHEID